MKTQVRVLMLLAILALAAGWAGLRRGNAALEKRVAAAPAGLAKVAR
jgi:fructoselysine-6-P-deglycase FrlB-like protein